MKHASLTPAQNKQTEPHKANENMSELSRRHFIKVASSSLALLSFPIIGQTLTSAASHPPKIIWVLLRGALDSLHTIVPTADPEYSVLRPTLSTSFKAPLLPLEQGFALHPALVNMHNMYNANQLLPIVAVSSGYDRRSHFDGQDFLESGVGEIDTDTGWLARAIEVKSKRALAVARTTPISLRNSDQVNTWYPTQLANTEDEIYLSLAKLYKNDKGLSQNLSKGLELRNIIEQKSSKNQNRSGQFIELTKSCAKLMNSDQQIDCAMLELGGWDTHNNQAIRLDKKLTELDLGLAELQLGLGEQWANTVVIVATEFGRTAKENGTKGTDHGTGSAMFLAGGAIAGGKVKGDWPGLANSALLQQRDVMPTTNSFSWIATILVQHWGFSKAELATVFPHISNYQDTLLKL